MLHEVLGAGGTAVVYRASSSSGDEVAIKILHDHLSRSEEVCRRFVREGQVGNSLEHPGIVRVLGHGQTDDDCPYLVLELLEGESLEQRRVRLGGRLPVGETLEFCDQLLAVLEVAHARNIVHRDVKPSNLFVTSFGQLKVLDFGIARLVDDTSATATKTGQMIGTPAFMPPEQALSRPRDVDARTDLWSVGATLFTLISGEHVHVAESSSEHLVKAATLHARSLARALPGTPANVEAFVARSLSFDKAERWPSAAAMRAALEDVRADPGRGIGTSTSPPPDRTSPSASNMPTFVTRKPSFASPLSSDRNSDLDAIMALSSSPGVHSHGRSRRRWVVPVALAACSLLLAMSVAVVFVGRGPTPSPSPARGNAHAQSVTTTDAPVDVAAPAVTTNPAPSETTTAQAAPPAPATAPVRAAVTPAHIVPTRPPATKKAAPPAAAQPSRKDLYRPF